ncbi:YaaR family protein [Paraclostridium ghonii]|uniref:Uncharacterized protein YaaR (DUF327 family) n=1 Tax=Paraclostridium ghonii TaxID=29358 RepID=A0ABU0MX49_9FIRM|nr:DUF327 family protein [Paeniclostridium ghonii]MDQ0555173.1 uncharacterized protein YaaR (DUF327 family) [Paeniclostridium ghonii]
MKIREFKIGNESGLMDIKKPKQSISFSDSFNKVNILKTKEEVDMYLTQIKDIGKDLANTRGYTHVIKYKQAIQKYLKSVVDYTYETDKKDSFWSNNYFKTVKIVDEKLESLTKSVLENEKDNIDIISEIDDINGLLIDLYL